MKKRILCLSLFFIMVFQYMRETFVKKATAVVENLVKEKKITSEMTDREKAKVLFDWIVDNTTYDTTFGNESYTGYGQIINKKAVCQGYVATYNYMCKLVGLDVYGINGQAGGEEHAWTIAVLDGKKVHIDTTWGDPIGATETNYNYFAADSAYMKKTHTWKE